MFCNQCQETLNSQGCTKNGVCGKKGEVADLQDRLLYVLKSIALYNLKARSEGLNEEATDRFILDSFFATLTNTNFDRQAIESLIITGFNLRDAIRAQIPADELAAEKDLPAVATVTPKSIENANVEVHSTHDEDIRSLRELLTYGLKGMAAYSHHAYVLGYKDEAIFEFIEKGLVSITDDSLGLQDLIEL
jgi:hydroxylamine reductase